MKVISRSDRKKGIWALILLSLVYASMGLFARFLNGHFLILQQVYLRILAAFLLGLIVFRNKVDFSKIKKISSKEWLLLFFRAACLYIFGVTLFTLAINLTKYSNVSFIGALPTTAILGFVILHEKASWQKISLILLAFIGAVLIGVQNFSNIFSWQQGDFLALVSTIFFSFGYISRKWHSNLLNNQELTIITFFLAFISIFGVSVIKGDGLPIQGLQILVIGIVVLAGLANVANMFLTNYGFEKVDAVLASNLLTLESAFAVVLGFMFFREVPNLKELFGGFLILLSVISMNHLEGKK